MKKRFRPLPDPAMFHGLLGEVVDTLGPTTEADPVAVLVLPPHSRWVSHRLSDGPRMIRVDLNELDALLTPIPTAGKGAPAA
jgi:hypothetical protein